jgi:hypothetical protein
MNGQDLTIKTTAASDANLPRKNSVSYSPRTRTRLPFRDAFFWSQAAAKLGQIDKEQSQTGDQDTSTGSANQKSYSRNCRRFCWGSLECSWANVEQTMKVKVRDIIKPKAETAKLKLDKYKRFQSAMHKIL